MSRRSSLSSLHSAPHPARPLVAAPSSAASAALRAAARAAVETLEDRRLFAIELFAPIVSDIDASDVTGSPTNYVVTVNYLDDGGLDIDSIDEGDVRITGPSGDLSVVGVETSGDLNSLQAKYTVAAPTGGLAPGRYTVTVRDEEVFDLAGKSASSASETFDVEADTQPPSGAITVEDVREDGATHTVRVVFTDNVGIDASTISVSDLLVTRPQGAGSVEVTSVDISGSGTEVTAVYTLAAPGGSWSAAGNGTYNVVLAPNAVADTSGNRSVARIRNFDVNVQVDSRGPTAVVEAGDIGAPTAADAYAITVVYEDDAGVNEDSISVDNLIVTGPNGPLSVTTFDVDSSDGGRKLTVRYTIAAPDGAWDPTDNGDYTARVNVGAVTDNNGNGNSAGSAGFRVDLAPADTTAPTSAIANADLSTRKPNHTVRITFTDAGGIDPSTFGVDDIAVTGPGGRVVEVTDVSSDRQDGGRKYVVTYTLAGPGGNWDDLNNGTYIVALAAGSVTDTAGNGVAADARNFTVAIPAPDGQRPSLTVSAGDVNGPGGTTHTVRVTYTDNRAVRASTIDVGDIRVTGPAGTLQVLDVSIDPESNDDPIVATYTIAAPAGGWAPAHNGTYTIEVLENEITDTAGNGSPSFSDSFAVDAGPVDSAAPDVSLTAADVTGGTTQTVVVTYTDDVAIDTNTIGIDDLVVEGPGGGTLAVSTVMVNASNGGKTVVATYTIAGPSSGWNYTQNGTYAVTVAADAVRDQAGKGNAAASGSFRVAAAAPAPVDTSFGNGTGNVNTGFVGEAVVAQGDGNLLVAGREGSVAAGNAKAVLQRLTSVGAVDTTFGSAGRVTTDGANEAFFSVLMQGDQKILVAGTSNGDFLLARYDLAGQLDPTFGSGGRVVTDLGAADDAVYGLALAPDGRIVVTGGSGGNFAFARFTAEGAPDLTFDQGGKTLFDLGTATDVPGAVAVQSDGKIVAVGSSGADVSVVRLLDNGLPDPSFSGDGLVMVGGLRAAQIANFTDRSQALALQSDGKILIANHTPAGDNAVARLDGGGNLDGSFGVNGLAVVDFAGDDDADAIILQNTGEILVVGTSLQNGLARTTIAALSQSGTLIEGFGQGGKLVLDALPGGPERELHVGDLVLRSFGTKQNDGRIVVGTSNQSPTATTSALKRLIVPGSTSAPAGTLIGSFGLVNGKNTKLTIDAGGGKFVTFTMKGGNASIFQDGEAYSLLITDDGRGAAVTVKVKGGDGRVKFSNVSTTGSIKSFSAKTGDLSGTFAAGIQIGKVTLGDVTGGTIAAGASIASISAANLRDARVLAGTGLGSDRQLGGASTNADSYAGGSIGKIAVKGEIKNSLIGAGLNPVDGAYGDDDDVVVGGAAVSFIKSISAKLGADESTRFMAGAFKSAKLGKGKIDLATDVRFKTFA